MVNNQKKMYETCMLKNGFFKDNNNTLFNKEWTCYTLSPNRGQGHYWVYFYHNLFSISIMDFCYYEDLILEYEQPHYLSISYYESISGEELKPHKNLSASSLKGHFGNGLYQASYHKEIPIRCIGIVVMPEFYELHLKTKYPKEYADLLQAFLKVDGTKNFPELIFVLKQIKNCHFSGMAAKLYYESKVTEAISLILQNNLEQKKLRPAKQVSQQDLESLATVVFYLDNHLSSELDLNFLTKIACMGRTKLKYTFKKIYQCTIYEYLLQKRIRLAQDLLSNTDLSINQIAQKIGYKKTSSFSEIFRKWTGILPKDYRKISIS